MYPVWLCAFWVLSVSEGYVSLLKYFGLPVAGQDLADLLVCYLEGCVSFPRHHWGVRALGELSDGATLLLQAVPRLLYLSVLDASPVRHGLSAT